MPIDRESLVSRHAPCLTAIDLSSPLTVGNGGFAFTADSTGLQSLYAEYAGTTPLCTMAHWGWHAFPDTHTRDELVLTEYDFNGRSVHYAVEKQAGNEAVYDWLRQNPHRLNLASVALYLDGRAIAAEEISQVDQRLHLWEGILYSAFVLAGAAVRVQTACAPYEDTLAICVQADPAMLTRLSLVLAFPYGSPAIGASDWDKPAAHTSRLVNERTIARQLDATAYVVTASTPLSQADAHTFRCHAGCVSLRFALEGGTPLSPEDVFTQARSHWAEFWQSGGAIDLHESSDPRAHELERRIVLSQYLTAVQCAAPLPPQETGLTCNSWYGKFHLEMLPSHCAWMPLWGRGHLLKRVLPWYHAILPQAMANAASNGYRGARWPKMTGPEGIDSPSPIATLLVWQQPHIIWLLELLYREQPDADFLCEHWQLVRASADFMADFAVWNPARARWELTPPLIPVQEEFDPRCVRNPAFEVEYWREMLLVALVWAERLGETPPQHWRDVADGMVGAPVHEGVYIAHEACPETFTDYGHDHPSMLFAFGALKGERMQPAYVAATLERVLSVWDRSTLWGWDFGQMAMTATRLGLPELAVEILLLDTDKNKYVASGNNFQYLRSDLPLYLPGNGTLLLAAAMMCAGYDGCTTATPGFPSNGRWTVHHEGLNRLP